MSRNRWLASVLVSGLATATAPAWPADGSVYRATDWLGHVVMTRDGKELGTVRDLGIDGRSGKIVYVVVSVGSFLIENNLIAVAPDALVSAGTGEGLLVIDADPGALHDAKRFASTSQWPAAPDVMRAEGASREPPPAADEPNEPIAAVAQDKPTQGTATIESRSKTAHLSANERYIKENAPSPVAVTASKSPAPSGAPAASTKPRPEPITQFDRLDKDGDGVLNRSEFAPVITRTDSYSKIDANANGVIERQEFDTFEASHGQASN